MDKARVKAVLDSINDLILSEIGGSAATRYKNALKLAAYADRISQIDATRVAQVSALAQQHPFGIYQNARADYDPVEDAALHDDEPGGGLHRLPMQLMGGNLGGGPQDMQELLRQAIMAQQAPKPRHAGDLANDLQALAESEDSACKSPCGSSPRSTATSG